MKKILLIIISLLFSFSSVFGDGIIFSDGTTTYTSSSNAQWNVYTYENPIYVEFILNLKGSLLTENLKKYKSRIKAGNGGVYFIKDVNNNEEKIALKLETMNGKIVYFTNFDSTAQSNIVQQKFNSIELIRDNGQYKAKIGIYIHKDLNKEITDLLLGPDSDGRSVDNDDYDMKKTKLNLKSASYVYYGLWGKKIGKIIKVN